VDRKIKRRIGGGSRARRRQAKSYNGKIMGWHVPKIILPTSGPCAKRRPLLGLLDGTEGGAYRALRHFNINAATLKIRLLKRTPR
jgi:hypothetical protein